MSGEGEAVAWLRTQIADDMALAERVAARYVAGPGSSRAGEDIWPAPSVVRTFERFEDPEVRAGLDLVRACDPRGVVAGCEAKLALLAEHPAELHGRPPYWDGVTRCETCLDERWLAPEFWQGCPWPCKTMRLLASAYRHRDGWAAHWGERVANTTDSS
jgi:hypothetical protein